LNSTVVDARDHKQLCCTSDFRRVSEWVLGTPKIVFRGPSHRADANVPKEELSLRSSASPIRVTAQMLRNVQVPCRDSPMRKTSILVWSLGASALTLALVPGLALTGCEQPEQESTVVENDSVAMQSIQQALVIQIDPMSGVDARNPYFEKIKAMPKRSVFGSGPRATLKRTSAAIESSIATNRRTAKVELAPVANKGHRVTTEDGSIAVRLDGVEPVAAHIADGMVVYPAALKGADVIARGIADGAEDFVRFAAKPAEERLTYRVDIRKIAGVRSVKGSNTVEFLRADGTPVLRMNAPWGVDASGSTFALKTEVEGCVVDRDPRGPWGRAVTTPNAEECTISVSWAGADVKYPAVVDPTWARTGNPSKTRSYLGVSGAAQALLPSGKVLAAGGMQSTSTYNGSLDDAELFDPATGTWAATGGLSTARGDTASATINNDGTVMIAGGGQNPGVWSNPSKTTDVYSEATGMFTSGPEMAVARVRHRVVALSNNKVLFSGAGSNSAPGKEVEIYDTATKTFSAGPSLPGDGRFDTGIVKLSATTAMVVSGNGGGGAITNNAFIYDQNTNAWTAAGSHSGDGSFCPKALKLSDGRVALYRGYTSGAQPSNSYLWSPDTNTWTPFAQPFVNACDVGGFSREFTYAGKTYVATGAEVTSIREYDPATGKIDTEALTGFEGNRYANLITLKDGRVLAFGGNYSDNSPASEIFGDKPAPADAGTDAMPDAVADAAPDARPDAAPDAARPDSGGSSSSSSGSTSSSSSGGGSSSSSSSSSGTNATSGEPVPVPAPAPAPAGAGLAVEGGGGCSTTGNAGGGASAMGIALAVALVARRRRNRAELRTKTAAPHDATIAREG
jgi:uncharacterized protein (TIGR03382 family)